MSFKDYSEGEFHGLDLALNIILKVQKEEGLMHIDTSLDRIIEKINQCKTDCAQHHVTALIGNY